MTATAVPPVRSADRANLHSAAPPADHFETVACYLCGERGFTPFLSAEDDLTGKPGRFQFVTCRGCGLRYQNPRLSVEHVSAYYDDEYIAHRKKSDWGVLTSFFNWVMDRHDRQKDAIVSRYLSLGRESRVLDVGCAVGTFLQKMRSRYGAHVAGVDFKDLSSHPSLHGVDFRCGLFYEQDFAAERFDLITMWHFLEHDYDPARTLTTARDLMATNGRLVIEVPRLDSLTFRLFGDRWPGLQAPQHTALYDRHTLLAMVDRAGLEVVDYLPYGAFPAFFYFFAGAAFKLLRGKGLDLSRAIYPYFLGQILFAPVLAFEKQLNFAMQTVVCRRRA
jgi:2-polyprenyl-3-methyl-5-hydroxy-6-metoxy-1,4-benzoquinol methylase